MPKTKISEYSTTNSQNTDIQSINIDEGCAPSGINNAIRELMVHLRNFQTNASGDGATFASLVVQGTGSFTGAVTMSAGATLSGTNTLSGSNIMSGNINSSGTNTFSGSQVISGNINSSGTTNTFSGGNILSGTNTLSGATIISGNFNATGTTNTFSNALILGNNLTFTGTGNRITGDFSNATIANRVMFQTSTTNGNTIVSAIPNGTGTTAALRLFNSNDPDNASEGSIGMQASSFAISAQIRGTGTYYPMTFATGGSERMRIDTSGNVGIGTTAPNYTSAGSATSVLGVSARSSSGLGLLNINGTRASSGQIVGNVNFFNNGAATPLASVYGIRDASDTTGSLAFGTNDTERMRIDSSGRVGIGTTSPSTNLTIGNGGGGNNLGVLLSLGARNNFYEAYDGTKTMIAGVDNTQDFIKIGSLSSHSVGFVTGNAERMRIDSSGNVGIGTSSPSSRFEVQFATNSYGYFSNTGDNNTGVRLKNTGREYGIFVNGGLGSSNALRFYDFTADAERARITSGGDLLVGTTSTTTTNSAGVRAFGNGYIASTRATDSSAITTLDVYSTTAAAYRFYVTMAGTVFATNTTISAISDQRLKENIQDIDVGLNAVMSLKPRKFDWKEGKGKNIKGDRGWVAQEFEQVFPEMVNTWKDESPEGEEPYKSVAADLIPVLVKAIQELKAELDTVKAKLNALKGA